MGSGVHPVIVNIPDIAIKVFPSGTRKKRIPLELIAI
jgi:hypothetical protein